MAASIPYQNKGTENPFLYSFIATGGDVDAYFLGSGAGFDDSIGLLVGGVVDASGVFKTHHTKIDTVYDFGTFAKGTKLTFFIDVKQSGLRFYSDSKLNSDGENHVYSTSYAGSSKAPAGTYVGFEDLTKSRGWDDFNYTDEQFDVTNITTSPVPLPASAPLFGAALLALAGFGYAMSRWVAPKVESPAV